VSERSERTIVTAIQQVLAVALGHEDPREVDR
jgi:hypothetical protein